MKILGLDASTRMTGYGVLNESGELIKHGVIDLHNSRDAVEERIVKMIEMIWDLIEEVRPDAIYIEEMWNKMNIATTKSLSYVIGAVMGFAAINDISFQMFLPSAWRSRIGMSIGKKKREELKQEAITYVEGKYGITVGDDEAEGICIAYAGWLGGAGEALFD